MIDAASSNESSSRDQHEKRKEIENSATISCTPQKIYPLANERVADLLYPTTTYHYSVSSEARYVYVVGEDSVEMRSQLFVWDLHRGIAMRYMVNNLPHTAQMKHLYEIDAVHGLLVCRSAACFSVFEVLFDHHQKQIRIQKTLFDQFTINGHFWSSARAFSGPGIIFMSQHDQTRNFYVAQIGLDAPIQSVSLTARMSGLRFCGQPWVYGQCMYLFESASTTIHPEMKYLTGRLVRADLRTGELEIVQTKALGTIPNCLPGIQQQFQQQQQPEQEQHHEQEQQQQGQHALLSLGTGQQINTLATLIRRVKHVERNGWLWIIAEFVQRHCPLNYPDNPRCEICILKMETLTWHRLDWLPQCTFDELTLDVTSSGTVVMLRKKIIQLANHAQIDSFLLISRSPQSLLQQSFRALITYFPVCRNLNREAMHALGIPAYLLVP